MNISNSNPILPRTERWQSIDLLRGAIMVLMAIDHVRVYSGVPAGGVAAGVFFTRWVTNFCAPGFAFLTGVSAYLYGFRIGSKAKLAGFLLTRGLLLVLLELTLIRFCWTYNLDYSKFVLAGVIWMLGWCMVILSALVWLRPLAVGVIGLFIIFGQQLFNTVPHALGLQGVAARWWEFIYPYAELDAPMGMAILYVLVPWIGVMAAGYGFGIILQMNPARKKKVCLWLGLSAIVAFIVAGTVILLKNPAPPDAPPFIVRLLRQNKYPPSILFLLMTLGPLIALVPFAERVKGWFAGVLIIFGRVPMFYYLLHIPLIHQSALLVNLIREGNVHSDWYATAPFTSVPEEHRWSLTLLYLVYVVDLVILYFLCRWYAQYKASHPGNKWLRYI
ncbi:MAG TPA: heparan-alpha-glucosaminide N-acetyltransferase domain-containing protein [Puia sp.]|nr:heparan-alpha-glucosaminide N-acetyltransferase domain-containing protein [Puia sp.]